MVSEIFQSYCEGSTIDSICYQLNSSGRLTRRGNPWTKYNLSNILHNPVYAGFMRWEELLIRHDGTPVITPEKFNEVQLKISSRIRDPSKRNVDLLPTLDDF